MFTGGKVLLKAKLEQEKHNDLDQIVKHWLAIISLL